MAGMHSHVDFWTVFILTVESIFSFVIHLSLWESGYAYLHTGWCPTGVLDSIHFHSFLSLSSPLTE